MLIYCFLERNINDYFEYAKNNEKISSFISNNWNSFFNRSSFRNILDILNKLSESKCAIWLNSSGDLCYRLTLDGDIMINSWKKVGFVFHNIFGLDIEIKRYDYTPERNLKPPITKEKNILLYFSFS